MILLVTGGRDYTDRDFVYETLSNLHSESKIDVLIHGDATGLDTLAKDWAIKKGVIYASCPAHWTLQRNGAGSIRNRAMAKLKPDLVLAFPGGKGTQDMVDVARKAGIEVSRVNGNPKVYNRHHGDAPRGAVYIGRGTEWANPYVIGVDGNRAQVCKLNKKRIKKDKKLQKIIRKELKGKDLLCSCTPKQCHGDYLIKLANK